MNKEQIQEDEYDFPYHHLVQIKPFSQARNLFWGFEYASYLFRVIEVLKALSPFNSLVDIGCRDGKFLAELREQMPILLLGQDYSEHAIALSRLLVSGVEFTTDLPAEGKFDAFTCIEVVEHIAPEALPGFAANCAKAIKVGGTGVITTPSINTPLQEKHYRHFTPELLSAPFAEHFDIIRIEWLNARTVQSKLIQRILSNRLFILNNPFLLQKVFDWYKHSCLIATPSTGGRLLMIVKKKR